MLKMRSYGPAGPMRAYRLLAFVTAEIRVMASFFQINRIMNFHFLPAQRATCHCWHIQIIFLFKSLM